MTNEETHLISKYIKKFTNQLYQELSKEPGKNVFFSPLGIYTALALTHQGAEGKTEKIMTQVLNLSNSAILPIITNVHNNPSIEMANKIYIKHSYTIKENFKHIINKQFLAGADTLDFSQNYKASDIINTWVEEKTRYRVTDITAPQDLHALDNMVLINAIYFKGLLINSFKTKHTKQEPFYISKTDSINCEMMHRTGIYLYNQNSELNAKVLSIPYLNNVSLIVVLPNEKNGMIDLDKKLVNYDLIKLVNSMSKEKVAVSLPKFKIETTMEFSDALSNIGFGNIFSTEANFSKISANKFAVSKVIHKAVIDIEEEGGVGDDSPQTNTSTQEFTANHPFIFYLITSGIILFVGRVNKELHENVTMCECKSLHCCHNKS